MGNFKKSVFLTYWKFALRDFLLPPNSLLSFASFSKSISYEKSKKVLTPSIKIGDAIHHFHGIQCLATFVEQVA